MNAHLHPEAEREIAEAFDYFERQEAGLGLRFVRAVDDAIKRIADGPDRWPTVRRDVRRCLTRTFKYGVVYRVMPDEIEVLAIADLRRQPYYWWKRRKP